MQIYPDTFGALVEPLIKPQRMFYSPFCSALLRTHWETEENMANISAVKVEEFIENGQPTNEVTIRTKNGDEIVIIVFSEGWAIEVNGELVKER